MERVTIPLESSNTPKGLMSDRIQLAQKEKMINFMVEHEDFARQRFTGKSGRVKYRQLWEELAAELNKLGPTKEVNKWQRVWTDLKNFTKKKATQQKHDIGGNGGPLYITLSSLEEKVLSLITWDAVYIPDANGISLDRGVPSRSLSHSPIEPIADLSTAEVVIDTSGGEGEHDLSRESTSSLSQSRFSDAESDLEEPPRKRRKKFIHQTEVAKANELLSEINSSLHRATDVLSNLQQTVAQGFQMIAEAINGLKK